MTSQLHRLEAIGPADLLAPALDRATEADPPLALAASLFEHDGPTVSRLELLFDHRPKLDDLKTALGLNDDRITFALGTLADQNWVALSLEGLAPVQAGRFRLRGSHDAAQRGGVDLLIEAGEAFGTGHHGTTKGCLVAFSDLLKRVRPRRVLDVGTGTGALAIAAALVLRRTVTATDIDPIAVRVTQENAALNGVARHIYALEADGLNAGPLRGRQHDLVFANILAAPLQVMAGDIIGATQRGGRIILSGLLERQARAVLAAYQSRDCVLERRYGFEGWATLVLRRR